MWLAGTARAEERRLFFFGNSLVHHLTDSDETTVPYWLARMARAAGDGLALDGVWGFPADFARGLPPEAQWSFDGVPRVMDGVSFRRADWTDVVLAPPNFIQYAPPDEELEGGSAVALTTRVFDYVDGQAPGARLWLYEGWADMGEAGFPPSARGLRRWHDWNRGGYHDWYRDYAADVSAALGGEVGLIPVGSVLSSLLSEAPWDAMAAGDLYSDDSPHGTATVYLLAAMVVHVALTGEAVPEIDLPVTVHPVLRENYPAAAARVFALATGAVLPDQAAGPVDGGIADPSGAAGLAGIADWSSALPFLDQMKSARPWVGHLPGQWGGWGMAELQAGGYLSPEGWPLAMPPELEAIETFVLTDLPERAGGIAGRYVLRWQGQGALSVGGRASGVVAGDHEIRFDLVPGPGPVSIRISAVDPADPIRAVSVVRADRLELWEAGAIFNPDWLAVVADLRLVRFMDWMATNGSGQQSWADRPLGSDFSYAWRGVPVEVMVDLASQIGADPWFTLPHRADDAYVIAFATYVRDHLDPRLRVHAEWSNEVWNWLFPQARWAADQALSRWGADGDAWMQFAGLRAAEVADLWAGVFAEERARLVTVVGVQTSWPGLEVPLLDAALVVAEGRGPPAGSFDAYAVTGYVGGELGFEEMLPLVLNWLEGGQAMALTAAGQYLAQEAVPALLEQWDYHAGVAADRGMDLLMYEGGTHVVATGAAVEDEALTGFFTALNYSPEMAGAYAGMIAGWHERAQGPFNAFVEVAVPSKWGSWGHLRWLGDVNPRAATVAGHAAVPPTWDDPRPEGTFLQGVWHQGTDGPDRLDGTPQRDDLTAGGGDDVILAGPGDRVHGGTGRDRVLLAGQPGDWLVLRGLDGRTRATAAVGVVTMTAVEEVAFAAAPDVVLPLTGSE